MRSPTLPLTPRSSVGRFSASRNQKHPDAYAWGYVPGFRLVRRLVALFDGINSWVSGREEYTMTDAQPNVTIDAAKFGRPIQRKLERNQNTPPRLRLGLQALQLGISGAICRP
jgi:hypothetical protein